MSYILDALRKAAEQRGTQATALLRPSSPVAHDGRARRLVWLAGGVLVTLNVVALAFLLRPVDVPAPPAPAPSPAPPPRISMLSDIERPAPPPPPPVQVIEAEPSRRPEPAAVRAPVARAAPEAPAPATGKPAERTRADVKPPQPGRVEPRAAPPRPVEPRPVAPAAAAAAPPAPSSSAKLRLEVLSYSDVPAQRLVFINGRRYREGDTVDGGAKIEEIREDGVILSDDGQRFTLR